MILKKTNLKLKKLIIQKKNMLNQYNMNTCSIHGHMWKIFSQKFYGRTSIYKKCYKCQIHSNLYTVGDVPEYCFRNKVIISGLISCIGIFLIEIDENSFNKSAIAGHFIPHTMFNLDINQFTIKGRIFIERFEKLIQKHKQKKIKYKLIFTVSETNSENKFIIQIFRNILCKYSNNIITEICRGKKIIYFD